MLVAHALDQHHGPDEVDAWWSDARKVVATRLGGDVPLCVLIDANARVGSIMSDHVGDHAAQSQDYAGEAFHAFLQRFSLMAPATFDQWATGTAWATWVSSARNPHRID